MIKIKRGLNIPIAGFVKKQHIQQTKSVTSVALIGLDYNGLKPKIIVKVGNKVKLGQVLFCEKNNERIQYTSPGTGTITSINRGEKRVLQSVIIKLDGQEEIEFASYNYKTINTLDVNLIKNNLLESGLWTAFRTRPFSKVPDPQVNPSSIFVTAIDTQPLAVDPIPIIKQEEDAFAVGLNVLRRISKIYLCKANNTVLPGEELNNIKTEIFTGPHPSGLVGTHIHFLDPVSINKSVWSINYQDVIAFGKLFLTGKVYTDRIISIAGPVVKTPLIIRTRLGANLTEIADGNLFPGKNRLISGSILSGRTAVYPYDYLGRYHLQLSCLEESMFREFLHYLRAGLNKHSILNIFISKFFKNKYFKFTTNTHGSKRSLIPLGTYESVMPLDLLTTPLLRSLIIGDIEMAQKLGALELDEEDLALCTYVCPSKYEFGPILRKNLTNIEKEY